MSVEHLYSSRWSTGSKWALLYLVFLRSFQFSNSSVLPKHYHKMIWTDVRVMLRNAEKWYMDRVGQGPSLFLSHSQFEGRVNASLNASQVRRPNSHVIRMSAFEQKKKTHLCQSNKRKCVRITGANPGDEKSAKDLCYKNDNRVETDALQCSSPSSRSCASRFPAKCLH